MKASLFAKIAKGPECGRTTGYARPKAWPLPDGLQNLCIEIDAYTFCVHKSSLFLPRAAHGQAADAQGGLADANGDGLAGFAAGADAVVEFCIIANHRDFGE